jgi:hypothetical protein
MNGEAEVRATGRCLCGAVAFEVRGELTPPTACHCSQCRRQTGHYMVSSSAERADLHVTKDDGLAWYRSSDTAQRGFCKDCGSSLFWIADGTDRIAIALGTLDTPTGLRIAKHIFAADKSDYYDITDDVPIFEADG